MRYVRYIGLSHIRQITAQDWRSIGLTGDTVVWSAQNGFAVPFDQLTDEQIDKAIRPDNNFVITGDEDEEFVPAPQSRDMTPSQLVQTTETPVDVVDILEGRQNVSRDESGASKVERPDVPARDIPSGGVTKETGPK